MDRRQWQGVMEYLEQYGQKFGVVVSCAPFGEVQLANGVKILNLPIYLMERFEKLVCP